METPGTGGRRIAFFGGSFDPPHFGHLAIARIAGDALHLDEVLFAPVGAQPLKPGGSTASFADRVAMTQLAIAGKPGFALSLVDAPKPAIEPNYTFDSLIRLKTSLPAEAQLFCLMGADSLRTFSHWHRAAEIPFVASLIVVSRPGQSLEDAGSALPQGITLVSAASHVRHLSSAVDLHAGLLRNAAGDESPFYLLSGIEVDISATHVREWLRRADLPDKPSTSEPLPAEVLAYIRSNRLYQ